MQKTWQTFSIMSGDKYVVYKRKDYIANYQIIKSNTGIKHEKMFCLSKYRLLCTPYQLMKMIQSAFCSCVPVVDKSMKSSIFLTVTAEK